MKIWRGWGAYEEEDGMFAMKKGGEGEEIWGAKREKRGMSGLGSELDYYNGYTECNRIIHFLVNSLK